MTDQIDMAKITELQKQLMEQVPHDVSQTVFEKMSIARSLIEQLLLYLTSCGHKPWRPNPLSSEEQLARLHSIVDRWAVLAHAHHVPSRSSVSGFPSESVRSLTSGFGVIEEVLEYLLALGTGDRQNQLEEITDPLFFYVELVILSGFTWAEIEAEYVRKHAVNLKRYEDGKRGDWGWNNREKGVL